MRQSPPETHRIPRRIGLLGYDGMAALDLAGVSDAFHIASGLKGVTAPGYSTEIVGLTGLARSLALASLLGLGAAAPAPPQGQPQYDAQARMIFPHDYRRWVFLSLGLNMSYSADPAMAGHAPADRDGAQDAEQGLCRGGRKRAGEPIARRVAAAFRATGRRCGGRGAPSCRARSFPCLPRRGRPARQRRGRRRLERTDRGSRLRTSHDRRREPR